MKNRKFIIAIVSVLLLVFVAVYLYAKDNQGVDSFTECMAQSGATTEQSFPQKCTYNGKTYKGYEVLSDQEIEAESCSRGTCQEATEPAVDGTEESTPGPELNE